MSDRNVRAAIVRRQISAYAVVVGVLVPTLALLAAFGRVPMATVHANPESPVSRPGEPAGTSVQSAARPGQIGWQPEMPANAPSPADVHAALDAEARGTILAPAGGSGGSAAPAQDAPLLIDTAVASAVRPGGALQYEVRYTNTTGAAITNVRIEDTLSDGQSFDGTVQCTPALPPDAIAQDGLHVELHIGTVGPGASGIVRLSTVVDDRPEPSAEQPVMLVGNSARITGDGIPEDEDSAVATLVGPIFELTLDDGPDPVLPGHSLVYTLTLRNMTRQDAIDGTGMVISTVLPTDVSFLSASHGGTHDGGTVVWQRPGPLAPGGRTTVSVAVRVSETLLAPKQLIMDRDTHVVRSNEVTVDEVLGARRVSTLVTPLLAKEAEGPRRFGTGATAYPGDPVTYTLVVNNPRSTPLAGVEVTDTIPGDPGNFSFIAPLDGTAGPAVEGNVLRWTGIDLPALGSVTLRYTALVPRDAFIQDNSVTGTQYGSAVTAHNPDFTFPPATNAAAVRVFPPVILSLTVSEAKVQAGAEVVYTITMQNRGPFPVGSIRLTDTMAGPEFRFVGMANGPQPESAFATNPVVWTDLTVPAGGQVALAFVAIANGRPLTNYLSDLEAYTPETSIPARRNAAGVRIDSPFRISKEVTPEETYPDSTIRYDLELFNVTNETWTMSRVTDSLPNGFYAADGGRSSVVIPIDPPAQLRPGESWTASYDAYLSGDIPCDTLPAVFATFRGDIEMRFHQPIEAVFANATNLASIKVKPHVSSYVTATRQAVQPGDRFLYEIRVVNKTNRHGTNAELRLQVPEGFRYIETVLGPVAERSGDVLRFPGYQIPPNSDQQILVAMQAPQELGQHTGLFSGSAEGVFCIERVRGAGRVQVLEDVVIMANKPVASMTSPGGFIDFDITMTNKDPQPYPLDVVTNTMPPGFEFVMAMNSPEPTEVNGSELLWRNVTLPGNAQTTWRIRLRASTLFGSYQNRVGAHSFETVIRDGISDPVVVAPMIQLEKVAVRDVVQAGGVVPYTITLLNLTRNNYTTISITDVLPTYMTYEQMLLGPPPSQLGTDRNRPMWGNLSIAGNGGTRTLVFSARVSADAPEGLVIYNEVVGHSPDVQIPGTDRTAPVTVTYGVVPTVTPRRPGPTDAPPPATNTPGGPGSTSTPRATNTAGPSPTPGRYDHHVWLPWTSRR